MVGQNLFVRNKIKKVDVQVKITNTIWNQAFKIIEEITEYFIYYSMKIYWLEFLSFYDFISTIFSNLILDINEKDILFSNTQIWINIEIYIKATSSSTK